MNISDLITDRLAKTEIELADQVDWQNAKSRAITQAKLEVYGTDKAEADIDDDRIKLHIALMACVSLVDTATDYLMYARRLAENKDNANWSYHDTVQILQDKAVRYARQIEAEREMIRALIGDVSRSDEVIGISTLLPSRIESTKKLTPSPWTRPDKRGL